MHVLRATTHAHKGGGEMAEGVWGGEAGRKRTAMMLLLAEDLGKGGERRGLSNIQDDGGEDLCTDMAGMKIKTSASMTVTLYCHFDKSAGLAAPYPRPKNASFGCTSPWFPQQTTSPLLLLISLFFPNHRQLSRYNISSVPYYLFCKLSLSDSLPFPSHFPSTRDAWPSPSTQTAIFQFLRARTHFDMNDI